ncbi:hypothetical protein ACXZ1K_15915 [Pedobacter sp. PWIIR3]
MKKRYIYLIAEQRDNPLEYVDAAFDTQEGAKAYLNRYKDNEAEIFVCEVNPEYHSDKTSNCYYIELKREKDLPVEVMISNKIASAKMAIAETLEFNTSSVHGETIGIYLFATSEEEAVELALVRRNKAIEIGEWG